MQSSLNTTVGGPNPSSTSEKDTGPLKQAKLTPTQLNRWETTMSTMVWTAPGFQHLLYKLLNAQNNIDGEHVAIMTPEAGVACTDGKNIMINPESYFELGLPERVFVLAHEIVHNVYSDVEFLHRCRSSGKVPMNDGTSNPFDNPTMQKAMDARINALLIESRIGRPPKVTPGLKTWLDKQGPHDKTVGDEFGHFDKEVKGSDSVLDVYGRYYKEKFPDGEGGDQNGTDNPGGFDTVAKPGMSTGQNPQQAANQRNPGQWAVETAAAQQVESQRRQGNMAAALKRMFQQVLEPEVAWLDHIETLINRATGGGGYDWTQPNIWLGGTDGDDQYFAPAETGHGAGWIVIWGDTSGSRSDTEIASNVAELRGIMEDVNPQRLTMVWCDAALVDGSVVEITDPADLDTLKPVGGGGTDYKPVLDWIANQGETPDLFIGFTDGYVNFPPREHPFPTIWASSTDKSYPFGQVVRVNKRPRGL